MLPTLKNNAAAVYQGPVKIELLKGAGLLVSQRNLSSKCFPASGTFRYDFHYQPGRKHKDRSLHRLQGRFFIFICLFIFSLLEGRSPLMRTGRPERSVRKRNAPFLISRSTNSPKLHNQRSASAILKKFELAHKSHNRFNLFFPLLSFQSDYMDFSACVAEKIRIWFRIFLILRPIYQTSCKKNRSVTSFRG